MEIAANGHARIKINATKRARIGSRIIPRKKIWKSKLIKMDVWTFNFNAVIMDTYKRKILCYSCTNLEKN